MGYFLVPEELNDTSGKVMHMGTIDTCFTVDIIIVLWNALNIQTINYKQQWKHSNTERSHSAIWSMECEADILGISL